MRKLFIFALIVVFSVLSAGIAFGADTISLNLGHTSSTAHHYHTSSEKFAELVNERTDGRVKINIFPASQLGSLPDMTESTMLGTQDMVLTAGPILGNVIQEFQALYMPYIFKDYEQINRFDDSEASDILSEKLEEHGAVLLGWWENGYRVITNSLRPIEKPEDMAGMKLRIGKAQMAIDTFQMLKVNPTPIAISELYTALQLGTVDGQENPTGRVLNAKYYEVQDYLSLTRHQHVFEPLIMNRDRFESLPEDIQKVLLETGKEVALMDRKAVAEKEASEIEALKDKGMQVNEVDVPAFQEAMKPLYDKYASERGDDWKNLVKLIQEL